MDKKMHFFRVVLGMLLTSFMYTPNTQAVDSDVCALKTLYAWNSATAVCPDTCKDLNFTWTGRWLENKNGMHCTSNTADSICGCSNAGCCEACDKDVTSCSLSCYDQSPGSSAQIVCFETCKAGWNSCKNECGGCPDSKKEKEEEFKKEKKIPSPAKSPSASETKKSLNQEESPKVKELPKHEERPSIS